jgi:acyl carrier protein phosphodiesterase
MERGEYMKIKESLIHLLGGRTLEEYNDMRRIATEALSGWQSDKDTVDKEIENLKQSLDKYAKNYDSLQNRYIKLLGFVHDTFGNKDKSRDDMLYDCWKILDELDNMT